MKSISSAVFDKSWTLLSVNIECYKKIQTVMGFDQVLKFQKIHCMYVWYTIFGWNPLFYHN